MKKLIIILICLALFSCKDNGKTNRFVLSEKDAYDLLNEHISKQLNQKNGRKFYLSTRILKGSKIDSSYNEMILQSDSSYFSLFAPMVSPFYSFSDKTWDTTKLAEVNFVNWEEYQYYFQQNDPMNFDAEWEEKYGDSYLHCISFPEIIPETNIIIIKHILTRPYVYCGTGLYNEYFYTKTKNAWVQN